MNTLLGSSVPMDLFTGQSLMSSGSTVVVVVVDILGFTLRLLSYLRSMQRLPTTKPFDACFTTTSFYVNGDNSGFVSIFHVSLTCLETFWGDISELSVFHFIGSI